MPLNLKAILKDVRNTELVLTNPYRQWLMAHGDDPYPDWVVDIIETELRKKPRYRPGTFSASSSGQCLRKQELDFLGMPSGDTIDPQLQNIFSDGKWRHLRWQANLLSAGLLTRIEVPLRWRRMQSYGTMDGAGEVPDDHPRSIYRGLEFGFELKGVNPWDYAKAVKRDDETKEAHKRQVHRYFCMSGVDLFVTVYENKATNEWHEWVEFPDETYMQESIEELQHLNEQVGKQKLDPMLTECRVQTGLIWESCPYGDDPRGSCMRSGEWPRIRKGK